MLHATHTRVHVITHTHTHVDTYSTSIPFPRLSSGLGRSPGPVQGRWWWREMSAAWPCCRCLPPLRTLRGRLSPPWTRRWLTHHRSWRRVVVAFGFSRTLLLPFVWWFAAVRLKGVRSALRHRGRITIGRTWMSSFVGCCCCRLLVCCCAFEGCSKRIAAPRSNCQSSVAGKYVGACTHHPHSSCLVRVSLFLDPCKAVARERDILVCCSHA